MNGFGFIHDKLDIKILILFILRRLPSAIDLAGLTQLTLCDDGIGYFDYVECLDELEKTGHIICRDGCFLITDKGSRDGGTIETGIPYSVRSKAERAALAKASAMRRDAMIKTSHEDLPDGACSVELTLADGFGEIISMKLLSSGREQAIQMENNFRTGAESIYTSIVELLLS